MTPVESRNGKPTQYYADELQTSANLKDRYDNALEPFRAVAPSPTLGMDHEAYSRKAGNAARKVLPPVHELKNVDFRDLPRSALGNFTERMISAVSDAAFDPSTVAPGNFREIAMRDADNNMLEKRFIGPTSFVVGMQRPSRRVAAIRAPLTENLIRRGQIG